MANRVAKVHVSESGRMSLPVDMRRAMGLEKGGIVNVEMVDGKLQIMTTQQIVARVQQLARDTGLTAKASVDDFLHWKQAEAKAEEQRLARK